MAKRIAEKELTDRNWDQEDEAEEVGTFSVASEEVLKNRAIKRAKRRNVGFESDSGGAFKDFKGLVVPSGGGGFSGFGNGAGGKPLEGLSNGNSITSAPPFSSARTATETKATFELQQESTFLFHGNKTEDTSEEKVEAVSEKNKDPSLGATSASFNFGKKIDSSVLGSLNSGPLTGFSFSSGNSSLFGKEIAQSKPVSSPFSAKTLASRAEGGGNDCKGGDEEENDEPPKVVVTEVKEEDAFYSKKCKLFYKKDNEFKEKGVGTLHLKPTANQKTQLLVRADTNLGNILLNVLIPPNMPCTRTGRNNVLIVCVPNPPTDEKNATTPVTMLIRVKTSEDADELHTILQEKKDA
ncbi:nuclear pore complex protein Nup50 isoform X2 [Balaenoptera ricei]|uniref:nuclear pore complex protein Nup50 isoform X2 n=1 Tax=Balaenoptera ricei TaxID=2746895 RepID=UPI0028BD32C6|nr:nuclear pore complex protein Nup50 isoform X2 [Balaenoptera ricei]